MGRRPISAFDAKTRLSELLRDAEAGQSYLILRRGKPVAQLTPTERGDQGCDYKALAASLRAFREGLGKPLDVHALVEEGRRH